MNKFDLNIDKTVMKLRYLKTLRMVIAVVFFMLTAFIFLDFRAMGTRAIAGEVLYLQFVPSMLNFLNHAAIGAAGFILVLSFTLLFGRIYCSTVCPLGTLQDIISRMTRTRITGQGKKQKRQRFTFTRPQTMLRYGVFSLTALFFIAGSGLLLNFLDPFSNFGRIFTNIVRPLLLAANNLIAHLAEYLGSNILYQVQWQRVAPVSMGILIAVAISLAVLALVGWLSARHGRLYCNSICPVGTLLGLFAKISLLRIQIESSSCIDCRQCQWVCKAGCIDLTTKSIDISRCVACYNCLAVCPSNALQIKNHWQQHNRRELQQRNRRQLQHHNRQELQQHNRQELQQHNRQELQQHNRQEIPKPRRREFILGMTLGCIGVPTGHMGMTSGLMAMTSGFMSMPTGLMGMPTGFMEMTVGKVYAESTGQLLQSRPTTIPEKRTSPVSPPGSVSIGHFTSTCTACHLCVSICPSGILVPSFLTYGISGLTQPHMNFQSGHCNYECTACTEVCPSGAILPISKEKKKLTQIGVAKFIKENCVVYTDNTNCGACSEHCPTKAVHMVPYHNAKGRKLVIPKINESICVGCGGCEHACPTKPYRAIYIDGNPVHRVAEKPVEKILEQKMDGNEDFPF
ncbi:4Fe-4S ferredoxin iron-sulfur binding domain-containing protein [Desulfamplus magnetovallimortis]|uniref:4Fe-4S ferredoxin iron-sulfur binding domain-containing protein n=1 Tax=Desulfamplus magnetovallimortis TaxID=1246637 RepID=A0A1W1H753_9BACT|nr:4Fe-4S binding protein [Desulfamplus magnetovallimortis]SLM28264.1 4Fe-4S ferredoxin iron-sulfur binding domain-containing protein [Desulfamplus magnetovallimortis]